MDIIRRLCERQKPETRRRILAAYYLGGADRLTALPEIDTRRLPVLLIGEKVSRETIKRDVGLLRNQAD